MASPQRFAVRDAGEATYWSLTTGKPIVTLRTLKTSGVETSGDTQYSRGGRGNAKLVGFSSNREAKLKFTDAIFDINAIQMITGNDMTTGSQTVSRNELVTVNSNAGTLTKTPVGNLVAVYKVNADGTNGSEITKTSGTLATGQYQISSKALTFFAGDITNGSQVRVYYNVATDVSTKMVKVTSDQFGKTFKVTVDVLVRDEYTKADYAGQIIIPNAKFMDNFSFDFAAEGDPAVLNLEMEVLKSPTSTDMWQLVIYDDSLVV